MTDLEVAKYYFHLSNKSDFAGISDLLTDSTTYNSQNMGIYLGRDSILEMQKKFHGQFNDLKWHIDEVIEEKPGIVRFRYRFTGVKRDGDVVESAGTEYVIVRYGKILHISITSDTQ